MRSSRLKVVPVASGLEVVDRRRLRSVKMALDGSSQTYSHISVPNRSSLHESNLIQNHSRKLVPATSWHFVVR